MTETLLQIVSRYAEAHAEVDGRAKTPIAGVTVMRLLAPVHPFKALYKPSLCLVLQGAKEVSAQQETHILEAGQALVVSADIPITVRVLRANRREPYLGLAIDLDISVVRELIGQSAPDTAPHPVCLCVGETEAAIADCALRLMRLVTRPEAACEQRTAIVTELHHRLLAGRCGPMIRRLAVPGGIPGRIARAVAILRAEFTQPLAIGRLAAAAGMSPSSFHAHFKATTLLTPMQFQKQLRLLEARRLVYGGLTAVRAASDVGYQSPSQFSREYARMFGVPPRRDAGGIQPVG